jgi:hypothetical protein
VRVCARTDDDDLPAEPQLVVPDLDTIPLPPPFIPASARSLQGERHRVVSLIERTAVVSGPSKAPMGQAIRQATTDNAAEWAVGLLDDDEGYLRDAFLMRLSAAHHQPTVVLQALVAMRSERWKAAVTTKNESESEKRAKGKEKDQMETEGDHDASAGEADAGLVYYGVWEKGREPTPQVFVTREEAVAEFERRFKALTGNAWAERQHQHRYIREAEAEAEFLYLPTNHEAVCEQLQHSTNGKNDEVERVKAALPAPGTVTACALQLLHNHLLVLVRVRVRVRSCPGDIDTRSDEQRVFDLLSFVSNKHQIFGYCQR